MRSCILVSLGSMVAGDFRVSVPGLGDLQGKSAYAIDKSVAVFQGIPYAKAPVGDLRWRAPEPYGAWDGVRDATAFGATCMGSGDKGASEDCLFLNVAAPSATVGDENARHSVMAWIHGGTYDNGAGSDFPAENVVYYSEQPVVVATINYRINMFGFLGSQSLAQRSDGTGNYGLQDQRLALGWLREHVGAFGGDGHAITLFGESAGGNSLIHHLVQPASAGLFQRIIVESGTYKAGYGLQDAEAIYEGIRNHVGCPDVDCLLAKDAQELSDAKDAWAAQASLPELHWGPVVDGVSMDDVPQELIAAGRFQKDVAVLIGSNLDEFSIFINTMNLTAYKPRMSESEFEALIGYLGVDNVRTVKQVYDPSVYEYPSSLGLFSQWWWMAMRVATDNGIPFAGFIKGVALGHCSMRRVAENLLRGGAPSVHMYNFARSLLGGQVGHGMDVPFVFAMDLLVGTQPGNKALSTAMIRYWTSFAASGTPSASGMPEWPEYDLESRTNVRLDATWGKAVVSTEQSYRQPACDFWDSLAGLGSGQVLV